MHAVHRMCPIATNVAHNVLCVLGVQVSCTKMGEGWLM